MVLYSRGVIRWETGSFPAKKLTRKWEIRPVFHGGFKPVALLRCLFQDCLFLFWASQVYARSWCLHGGVPLWSTMFNTLRTLGYSPCVSKHLNIPDIPGLMSRIRIPNNMRKIGWPDGMHTSQHPRVYKGIQWEVTLSLSNLSHICSREEGVTLRRVLYRSPHLWEAGPHSAPHLSN